LGCKARIGLIPPSLGGIRGGKNGEFKRGVYGAPGKTKLFWGVKPLFTLKGWRAGIDEKLGVKTY